MTTPHKPFWRRWMQAPTASNATLLTGNTPNGPVSAMRPLALEQRFMFDGAGAVDAVHAAHAVADGVTTTTDAAADTTSALRHALMAQAGRSLSGQEAYSRLLSLPAGENFDDNTTQEIRGVSTFVLDGFKYTITGPGGSNYDHFLTNAQYAPSGQGLGPDHYLRFDYNGEGTTRITIELADGSAFRLMGLSFFVEDSTASGGPSSSFYLTPAGGAAQTYATDATYQNVDFSANTDFYNITSISFTSKPGELIYLDIDDLNIAAPITNVAPTVANAIPDQNASKDTAFNFQFAGNSFSDANGDTLSYSAQRSDGGALPVWLSFDPATRTFSGTPGSGDSGMLSIDVIASDGQGGTVTDTFSITVAGSMPPVIANLHGDSVSYTEGSPPVRIDVGGNASVTDADNANFSGGNVTAVISNGGVTSEDVLSVHHEGSAAGQIGVSGNQLSYGGVEIASFTGGSLGNPLVISLNSAATPAAVSALLHNISYSNTNGGDINASPRSVQITVNDGAGGTSATASVTVNINAVNDAPIVTTTGTNPTYTEDGAAVQLFSGTTISTVESGQAITSMVFTVTNLGNGSDEKLVIDGSSVSLTNGNSVTTPSNGVTVSVLISGTTATVTLSHAGLSAATAQTIVNGMAYRNDSQGPSGSSRVVTLASVRDSGGTANGGTDTSIVGVSSTVTVIGVNDAPILNGTGGSMAWTEGNNTTSTPVVVDGGLTITDADGPYIASATVRISGNYSNGNDYLELVSNPATMGNVTGSWDASTGTLTLTSAGNQASLAQFQAALRAVTYTNLSDNPSTATRTVQFLVNDGSLDSSALSRSITITAVDDAPVITAPTSTMVVEDVASVLKQISISDADSNNGTVTLSVGSGSLAATSGGGVTVGGTSSALTLTGTLADVNAFIANNRLTYTTAANATANVTLTIAVDTGSVGTDTKTMTLTVTPVNDAPVVTAPGNITVVEDVPGALTNISFSDVDAGSASVTVTFSVPSGTLSAVSGSGVTAQGSGTGTLTLSGSLSDINAFIAATRVSFQTALNSTYSVLLTVSINDNGNTGGAAQTDTKTVTINVTAVNDAPVNHVPAAQSTSRDVVLAFNTVQSNAISISDVDAGSSLVTVTLSAVNGTLSLTATSGVTLETGNGVNNSLIRLQGSLADINATLQSLTFKPNAGFVGTAQLSIQTNDEGNTGSGGAKSDTDTVLISVNNPNPSVSNVVAYGPNGNGPYKAGDTITVAMEFNQNVYVAGGTPMLLLETGTIDRFATYTGGSGTNTLFFTYTVQAGDRSADLDYQSSTALTLNGATIANSQADAAIVSLPTPGSAGSLGANASIVIDTVAPTVNSATFPANGTYVAGQLLDFRFNFTEALIVDTSVNTPYLEINIGGQIRHAEYLSGSSTSTLVFRYIVQSGDSDSDGIAMSDNVRFTGNSIRDAAGNPLDPRFAAGATPNIQIDALAPEVTGITLDGPAGPDTLAFTVTFSEDVSGVDSSDFSLVPTGSANGQIASVMQINARTYTVHVQGLSGEGTVRLDLNSSGTGIVDQAGNAIAGGMSGSIHYVDDVAPAVISVNVPADGSYIVGKNLDFTVNFSESVVVDTTGGAPRIAVTLDTGGTVYANYVSGSGGSALVFRMTVASGQLDSNGISLGSSIQLNGGTLRDTAGNDTVVTLNSVASTTGVHVDGVVPEVASVTVPADGSYRTGDVLTFTVNASESVSVDTQGGTPRLRLDVGGSTRYASYVSGSGSAALVFTYIVQAGDNDGDGITLAGPLDLNGGAVRDAAGNSLAMALNAVGATAGIVVDTTAPTASLSLDKSLLNAQETAQLTVRFSEAVTGLTTADFTVANGTLSNLRSADGGITWTATFTPNADITGGTNLITLNNTAVTDLAGNAGSGTTDSNHYAIDTERPTATITVADNSLIAGQTSQVTITFSEAVTGFSNANLTVANGTLSAVSSSDGGITWTATFTPTAGITGSTNLITLNNTGVQDGAGNTGMGTTSSNSYAIDTVLPAQPVLQVESNVEGKATVRVDALVAGGHWEYSLDGGQTWAAGQGNSVILQGAGVYALQVRQSSALGNMSTASLLSIEVFPVVVPPTVAWPSFESAWGGSLPGAFGASTGASAWGLGGEPPAESAGSHTFFALGNSDGRVFGASGLSSFFSGGVASENQELSLGFLGVGHSGAGVFGASTLSGLFSLAMPESGKADPGPVVRNAVDALEAGAGQQVDWQVPPTLFGHSDPLASVQLSMTQADGRALPAWLKFDARTGKLTGTMPEGFRGELVLRLTARDSQGHAVHTPIKLKAAEAAPVARTGVAEQLQHAAQLRAGQMTAQRLHI